MISQWPSNEGSHRSPIGLQDKRMANRLAMVIMVNEAIREEKNNFHLALVVTRISIKVIEIFAVASAEGVKQNPIHSNFTAVCACSEDREVVCLPRP